MIGDRIRETTSTTGTGTWTLNGAVTGFVSFASVIGTGNQCYYEATDGFGNWEAGIGTVTGAAPYQLSRDTVIESSNSNTAVNFLNTVTVRCGPLSEMLGPIGNRFSAADTTGGANAYNLTLQPTPRTLQHLMRVVAKASFANTGACTLNLNGTGPLPLRKGDGTTDLASGDILANQLFQAFYDAPNSRWLLDTAGIGGTLSGYALLAAANVFTVRPQTAPSWITTGATGGDQGAGTINATTLYEAGTSLASKYGQLAVANVWGTAVPQTFKSSAAGAAADTGARTLRDKGAAGTINDFLTGLAFAGKNSNNAQIDFSLLVAQIGAVTAGAESGKLSYQTIQSGTMAERFRIGAGLSTASASGGDMGGNTINASQLYDDGNPLGIVSWAGTASGTNTILLTPSPAWTSYTSQLVAFKAAATNTGATTINVSSLGAKNIFVNNAACVGGELLINVIYAAIYDGTQFQLVSPVATNHGGLIGIQVSAVAGTSTYTPTAGTNSVVVEVVGGGGGGGGAAATGAGQLAMGGSGGGGGYARKRITSSFSGVTITVGDGGTAATAGNNAGGTGGTSSFGALVSATGGSGGQGAGAGSAPGFLNASAGGAGSSGDMNVSGGASNSAIAPTSALVLQATGGTSVYGGGRQGILTVTQQAAATGLAYGGGATGGINAASQTAVAGAKGGAGIVIVWEYS